MKKCTLALIVMVGCLGCATITAPVDDWQRLANDLRQGRYSYGVSLRIREELYYANRQGYSWERLGTDPLEVEESIEYIRRRDQRQAIAALQRLRSGNPDVNDCFTVTGAVVSKVIMYDGLNTSEEELRILCPEFHAIIDEDGRE